MTRASSCDVFLTSVPYYRCLVFRFLGINSTVLGDHLLLEWRLWDQWKGKLHHPQTFLSRYSCDCKVLGEGTEAGAVTSGWDALGSTALNVGHVRHLAVTYLWTHIGYRQMLSEVRISLLMISWFGLYQIVNIRCVVPSCFILILQLESGWGAAGWGGKGMEWRSLLKTSAHCAERGTKLKETSYL